MSQFVKCGALDAGAGACDLVVDIVTGEVVIMSDLLGNCYLSEITVLDPITPASTEAAMKVAAHFNADGVIMSMRNIITIVGNKATYRNFTHHDQIESEIVFDTDVQCETPILLDEDLAN